jgi:hypothetical protein
MLTVGEGYADGDAGLLSDALATEADATDVVAATPEADTTMTATTRAATRVFRRVRAVLVLVTPTCTSTDQGSARPVAADGCLIPVAESVPTQPSTQERPGGRDGS